MDERTLLERLRQGAPGAVGDLSTRYRSRLVAYLRRLFRDSAAAEDVVQGVFMKISKDPALMEINSLSGWLHAVAHRAALDHLRHQQRRTAAESRPALAGVEAPPPSQQAEIREEWSRVASELHALPEPYRTALTLRYLEGLEFKEIAVRLQTLERTARTWVGRGLSRLRVQLGARS